MEKSIIIRKANSVTQYSKAGLGFRIITQNVRFVSKRASGKNPNDTVV